VSHGPDNLVLNPPRDIRADIVNIEGDMAEIPGFLEAGYAPLSRRVDRLDGNATQIKRRWYIVDAPTA
jgi:hypothetical protein